jgi:hypothetical protein
MNPDTLEFSFKCMSKSETNSVVIEDLKQDTWHSIDVRAVNKYGFCPLPSKKFGVKTISLRKGSLFGWGSNKDAEL